MKQRRLLSLLLLTALTSIAAGYLAAQQRYAGVRSTELAVTDLGPHFECMQGMTLKMTRHEIDPHKGGSEHSHLGRPEVFYVLKGTIVEHQGSASTEYSAGEGFVSNEDLSVPHRIENASDTMSEVLDVQIVAADP